MSTTEIIAELPKLSSRERRRILDRLLELDDEAERNEEQAETCSSLREMLLRHAGKAVGFPEDMAAQHDQYLRGTPKR